MSTVLDFDFNYIVNVIWVHTHTHTPTHTHLHAYTHTHTHTHTPTPTSTILLMWFEWSWRNVIKITKSTIQNDQKPNIKSPVTKKGINEARNTFNNHRMVLTIHHINKLQTACFVCKAINKLSRPRISILYVTNSEIHSHKTRQTSKLHLLSHRLNIRKHGIRHYGTQFLEYYCTTH